MEIYYNDLLVDDDGTPNHLAWECIEGCDTATPVEVGRYHFEDGGTYSEYLVL
jgi:hypothetical protein